MSNDRKWVFDLCVTVLAAPFIVLEKLFRLAGRAVIWVVRNRRANVVKRIGGSSALALAMVVGFRLGRMLDDAFGDDPVVNGIMAGLTTVVVLIVVVSAFRRLRGLIRAEGHKAEAGLERESGDLDSFSDQSREREKEAAEESYARLKEDERKRLADESMPEEERREWENFYAQKRREIREEIRKWI